MDPRKSLLDKAVQTDLSEVTRNLSFSRAHTFSHTDSLDYLQSLDISQLSDTSSAYHSLSRFGAYTYSDISFLDDSRHLSDRPAAIASHTTKYGQLAYNKPIGSPNVNNRVVSLPETSPPYRIASENTVRVVSMPERFEALRHPAALSEDCLDHSGCLNMSLALQGESNLRESFASCTLFPSSPETSSPPSSPESVMIIGNDTQVHPAFLRPKSSIEDEERNRVGWIPVKGSPPKPIPALHGPLSLPYARCPSGAEGTLVEGEDLTHMIWGLDSNGLQAVQTKPTATVTHRRKAFHPIISSKNHPSLYQEAIVYTPRDQDVIDLSRPEFHTSLPNDLVSGSQQNQPSRTYPGVFENSLQNTSDRKVGIYEIVRRDSPIQLFPGSLGLSQSEARWNTGLGIDLCHCARENSSPSHSGSAFSSTDNGGLQSLNFLGSNQHLGPTSGVRQMYSTPLGFSEYDARVSGGRGQGSGILTPPDTSSPQWSPRFRQTHPTFMSPDAYYESGQGYIRVSDSRTREELTVLHKELEPAYLAVDLRRRAIPSEAPDTDPVTSSEVARPSSTAVQPFHKSYAAQNRTIPIHGSAPPSPVSPDLRRNLSQQQTRSIPLTRLIQRRLSSVAEEEHEMENITISRVDKFPVKPSATTSIVASKAPAFKEVVPVQSRRTLRPSGDNRKQNKMLISVPRPTSGNASNTAAATHRPADATDVSSQKLNMKTKKFYRKRKHPRKQTVLEA